LNGSRSPGVLVSAVPKGFMQALVVSSLFALAASSSPVAAGARVPVTVYLERHGMTVQPGQGAVSSSRAPVEIPPFARSASVWRGTVACLQGRFAPFAVDIVGLPSTRRLELVSAKPLRSGAVAVHYRRAR
jgi:hypothetical protein